MSQFSKTPLFATVRCGIVALSLAVIPALNSAGADPKGPASSIDAWGGLNYDLSLNSIAPRGSVVIQIAAGDYHSVALRRNGKVLAWGDNRFGQTNMPERVRRGFVVELAAGNIHTLALMGNGTVVGSGPCGGQYGDFGQCAAPAGLKHVVAVAAGPCTAWR